MNATSSNRNMEMQRKGLFGNKMPALGLVLLLLMLALPLTTLVAQVKMTRAEYVEMYKEIAVREMVDFSIPEIGRAHV